MSEIITQNIVSSTRNKVRDFLKINNKDIFIFDNSKVFYLSELNLNSSSIKVYVNDEQLLSEWSYDPFLNRVFITIDLNKCDNIIIIYDYYQKYSDKDILNAISAVLMYFSQYRYYKYFYFQDMVLFSKNIESGEEEDITSQESEIISLLASIFLEPDNITLKSLDFAIIRTSKESTITQIQDTFVKWLKTYSVE